MKKFSFAKFFGFALVLLSLIFDSCSFFSDSWNEPVKDYFQKYTETSAVTEYEVVSGVYEKGSGKIFVSSSQDFEVRLFLRNPQNYIFPADCISLSFPNFDKNSAEEKFGSQIDTTVVSLLQDESDSSVMILKYPAEFLALSETGFDISPEIRPFIQFQRLILARLSTKILQAENMSCFSICRQKACFRESTAT